MKRFYYETVAGPGSPVDGTGVQLSGCSLPIYRQQTFKLILLVVQYLKVSWPAPCWHEIGSLTKNAESFGPAARSG